MNKESKVLHLIDSLAFGGAQTVVKGIFESQSTNLNFFLFALRRRETLVEVNHPNVQIYNSTKKYSFTPLFILRDLINKENINILHCHLFRSIFFGLIVKLFFFPKIKLIFHIHGSILEHPLLYMLFFNFFQKKIDVFIAVSFLIKKEILKITKVPESKIIVLYNFVDLSKFNKNKIYWDIVKFKKDLGLNNNDFVVGFGARLVKLKGWTEFLEAASLITKEKKVQSIKFFIVGDGKDKLKMLSVLKKLNLNQSVFYLGYEPDMIKFYSILDCFVMPSHREAMGIAELEAQALGVPVVVSDIPGLAEIIINNQNGITFMVGNSFDLAEKIKLIANNYELRKSIIKNSLNNISKYSLENYLITLNKIYEDIK